MSWDKLVLDVRFGLEDFHDPRRSSRTEFQRDFDRLVFSSPFRRLQNKTQVFPLPGSIFVHNRLTHSIEVSTVGRSLANEVAIRLRERWADEPWVGKLDSIGEIVAAACLAHDLGNPPFGHSGEKAIATFFSEGKGRHLKDRLTAAQWADMVHFEGNANAFRLLTHRFKGRRPGGFAMTYSTLASIVKYPFSSTLAGDKPKFGFFDSERADFNKVAEALGMIHLSGGDGCDGDCFARHPLVYLVEAADDICYEVMDLEDAHKLGIIPTEELKALFLRYFDDERQAKMQRAMGYIEDPNEQIGYLRSSVIGTLVNCCVDVFVDNEEKIMTGVFEGSLLDHIAERERQAYSMCSSVSWDRIYCAPDVVDIELAGNRIITFLMETLMDAALHPGLNYSRLLLSKVPRQYEMDAPDLYERVQAVVDHVSGMTDVYALDMFRKLNGMSLKINN